MSKIVLLVILSAILLSLGLALVYLVRDRGTTERTVRALTWRIGLSVLLFLILVISAVVGLIRPQPAPNSAAPPSTIDQGTGG
jgi:putative copper export protein